jgi:hypothetical protein
LDGLHFDSIEEVSEIIPTAIDEANFLPLLEMTSRLDTRSSGGHDRLEVLMRTFLADRMDHSHTDTHPENFTPRKVVSSFIVWLLNQMAKSLILRRMDRKIWMKDPSFMSLGGISLLHPASPNLEDHFATFASQFAPGQLEQSEEFTKSFTQPALLYASMYADSIYIRRLARTYKNNILCLTSPSTEKSDQIWYLKGARVPFVLRELPNGNFDFRGEAYVHGCMDGEIFSKFGFKTEDARQVHIQ